MPMPPCKETQLAIFFWVEVRVQGFGLGVRKAAQTVGTKDGRYINIYITALAVDDKKAQRGVIIICSILLSPSLRFSLLPFFYLLAWLNTS